MTIFNRILDLKMASKRSILLLGPRQIGKSTLVRQLFLEAKHYDCLENDTYRRLSARPEIIRQEISS
ncbi:MAG: ATP-binding protein [Deltaproteobacteria bacterium]|nr:ATP-binding protein [Deltaproteobacteria bacterium]